MRYSKEDQERFFDGEAIREILDEYWVGLGRHEVGTVASVFAADATYGSVTGRDNIAREVEAISHLRCINILRGSQRIVVNGDEATSDTQAVAFLVPITVGPEELLVQGLRYVDRLKRTIDGWRIAHRAGTVEIDRPHDTPWEVVLPVRAVTPPSRIT